MGIGFMFLLKINYISILEVKLISLKNKKTSLNQLVDQIYSISIVREHLLSNILAQDLKLHYHTSRKLKKK